jgi:hypothetical protein
MVAALRLHSAGNIMVRGFLSLEKSELNLCEPDCTSTVLIRLPVELDVNGRALCQSKAGNRHGNCLCKVPNLKIIVSTG